MSELSPLVESGKFDCSYGVFVKTPDISIIEVVYESGLDFVVLDQEHAPFDRRSLDQLLFAARSLGLPALVRVPNSDASTVLGALDGGAIGILLPHVGDAEAAQRAADACRYASGRGYSGAVRSMRNRGGLASAVKAADDEIRVIAQIEDEAAIARSAEIAACRGIDALFIGRADLAVSMHASGSDAPEIWDAARTIADGAAASGKAVWAFAGTWQEADRLTELGARTIIFGSDQSHLKTSVSALVSEAKRRTKQ